MEKVVRIREAIAADLALRSRADVFLDEIERLPNRYISVDFSEIKSISRSFAHQNRIRKKASKKNISEIHVPLHVTKMFQVVETPNKKDQVVTADPTPYLTI